MPRAVRRGLILDAAEALLAEGDPLLVTFDEVAGSAGVARSLVHAHLGDRRGLVDAVQTRVLERLERWVAHGLDRADDDASACRALVYGTWSFVEVEETAWSTLVSTGGLDHPNAHALRGRWADAIDGLRAERTDGAYTDATRTDGTARDERRPSAALAVGGLLAGVGGWIRRGVDVDDVHRAVRHAALGPDDQR